MLNIPLVYSWNGGEENLPFIVEALTLWPSIPPPHCPPSPLLTPLAATVLYIYNEIQIRISRRVSMPRVTVWILLTLISWIMLIFTLSAHTQQTLRDMGVVTAVSVYCCVYVYTCAGLYVCESDCHVVKLICMWKGGLIISLMQMKNAHRHLHTCPTWASWSLGQKYGVG